MSEITSNFVPSNIVPLTFSGAAGEIQVVGSSLQVGETVAGYGLGRKSDTYLLPLKGVDGKNLKLVELRHYIDTLLNIAKERREEHYFIPFLATHYKPVQVALLFERVYEENITNVHLPREYDEVLQAKYGNKGNNARADHLRKDAESLGSTTQEG